MERKLCFLTSIKKTWLTPKSQAQAAALVALMRWPRMAECPCSPKTLSSHELAFLQDGEKGPSRKYGTKVILSD
ncbi:hypothetical protein [Desulfosporosinus sp. BG]|uniref:hypothetical protein n=1 Tax=Desulfosporosinus sp. BG TaxID=1633135 RepID=UPI00159EFCE0|nr:hypothetical protein [Desulfosporosinus sp. BG]